MRDFVSELANFSFCWCQLFQFVNIWKSVCMVGQNVVARLVVISTHLPWRLLHLTVLVSQVIYLLAIALMSFPNLVLNLELFLLLNSFLGGKAWHLFGILQRTSLWHYKILCDIIILWEHGHKNFKEIRVIIKPSAWQSTFPSTW